MAESRRDKIYVSARDTGLPGSPPPTPEYEAEDCSGECYAKTAFGLPSFHVENGVENDAVRERFRREQKHLA